MDGTKTMPGVFLNKGFKKIGIKLAKNQHTIIELALLAGYFGIPKNCGG